MTGIPTVSLSRGLRWIQRVEFPHKLGIADRLFGAALARHGIAWVDTAAGPCWKLDLTNSTHRWLVYGGYEGPGFWRWAERHLPPDAVVVDAGANIGQTVLRLATLVPRGRVFAFEPGRIQADWLAECLAANASLRVDVIRAALDATVRTVALLDDGPANVHGGQSRVAEGGVAVPALPLDEALAQRGVHHVHLWKLDVEGHEVPALAGARRLLAGGAIDAVYAELHADNGPRIVKYLADVGYVAYAVASAGSLRPLRILPFHGNALFLRNGAWTAARGVVHR